MTRLVYSSDAWRLLNGIVSIYKPPGVSAKHAVSILKTILVKELNQMERKVDPRFLAGKKNFLEIDPSLQGGPYMPQSKLIEDNLRVPVIPEYKRELISVPRRNEKDNMEADSDQEIKKEDLWSQEEKGLDDFNHIAPLEDDQKYPDYFENEIDPPKEMIDYSSHPLVLGDGYEESDFQTWNVNHLTSRASGVLIVGLNKSVKLAKNLKYSKPLLTYEVDCEFGSHTKTGFSDSPVIAKATWKHLTNRQWSLDQINSNIEASHQRQAWATAKVDPNSQEGYELACKGPIRPNMVSDTIIYSIRCTKWKLPNFSLRIQCVGDDSCFLLDTVAEIGIRLKSHAHTKKLRCYQLSSFSAEASLLPEQLSLQNVLNNISANRRNIFYNRSHQFNSNFNKIKYNAPPKMIKNNPEKKLIESSN